MPHNLWTSDEDKIVLDNYGRVSIADIQSMLPGRTIDAVYNRIHMLELSKNKVLLKSNRVLGRKVFNKNEQFFSNVNLTSAYWAGFIAADGCVSSGSTGTTLHIALKGSDGKVLEQFISDCTYTGSVKYSEIYSKQKGKYYSNARLSICSADQWAKDLECIYNITPRKTYTLQPPNITDPELIKAFITGYLDGDGCIRTPGGTIRFHILGTQEVLQWMLDVFRNYGVTKNVKIVQAGSSKTRRIDVHGIHAVTILSTLLTVDVPRLARKWDVAKEYMQREYN